VDCTKNESSYANITFGTFICQSCANQHALELGMYKSYVKPIFSELWDSYQLRVVSTGGNQALWDFLKDYKSENKVISAKYNTAEAKFYAKRLAAMVQGVQFLEKPPAKTVDDYLDKGADFSKKAVKKTEVVLTNIGSTLDKKFNQWFK
jgi:hypothetical protein